MLAGPKPGQHDYPLLNRVGENISKRFGVTFLDITSALQSRSDGHMPHDCGHWCLPGPYDLGAQLLYNAFVGHIDAPVSSLPQVGRLGELRLGWRTWSGPPPDPSPLTRSLPLSLPSMRRVRLQDPSMLRVRVQDPMRHGTGGGGGRSWSRSKAFGGKSVG